MLKIALIITGTIRNYKENYFTWKKHLLDLFDVDIFFHTYNIVGYHKDIYNNTDNIIFNEKEVIDLLKPKKYKIDVFDIKIKEFKDSVKPQCLRSGSPNPEFIKAQLYSIYSANLLKIEYEKENDFEYDIVIKIRFDTIFYSDFEISDVVRIYCDKNIILCGNPKIKSMKYKTACKNCNKILKKCKEHAPISDIVFIGKSTSMNFYAEIYNNYDKFIEEMFKATLNKTKNIEEYRDKEYKTGFLYKNIPGSECPFPEKILAIYLKDYILLDYSINLDINRRIV
ncbi:hypothetical protein QKU48_gp1113 [Fadolivirus algeromassiliense]|jgi:hypothetical protein|uniref:Uncharacterized protein n=1 Tax=Fadolivirus FV1/VV64 TaxID=3070911 RepID=A0A7D3UV11_9VIRU|nr:hypothetical protein QKU48_gp1113 [Fadolivirus algeromassiliense]QKF94571.1 hypothetical protein Fadolivirus_1_1113 [Fadolivirus FV1/VV64]